MRIDLHCHTRLSPDSLNTFEAVLRAMDRRGIDVVAITDHDQIDGAHDFHRRAPERFVVGEEIKTTRGEILALFLAEWVPPGLSPEETIERIHAQGGLAGASHPLDRVRSEAMGQATLEAIHSRLDFCEVFNARTLFPADNRAALEKAALWGLPGSAGSDAHVPWEVGRCFVSMPAFDGPDNFLEGLARGRIGGRLSSPLVHLASRYAKYRGRVGRRGR